VVIDDFDIEGIRAGPSKADSPLPVDPDAVLARTITLKFLQSVRGGSQQSLQRGRGVEHF
jgi:hypothetical protein